MITEVPAPREEGGRLPCPWWAQHQGRKEEDCPPKKIGVGSLPRTGNTITINRVPSPATSPAVLSGFHSTGDPWCFTPGFESVAPNCLRGGRRSHRSKPHQFSGAFFPGHPQPSNCKLARTRKNNLAERAETSGVLPIYYRLYPEDLDALYIPTNFSFSFVSTILCEYCLA